MGDNQALERLRVQLELLEQQKLQQMKEEKAKTQSVKVIVKGSGTKKEKKVGQNENDKK